jgi:hypothetical protein
VPCVMHADGLGCACMKETRADGRQRGAPTKYSRARNEQVYNLVCVLGSAVCMRAPTARQVTCRIGVCTPPMQFPYGHRGRAHASYARATRPARACTHACIAEIDVTRMYNANIARVRVTSKYRQRCKEAHEMQLKQPLANISNNYKRKFHR